MIVFAITLLLYIRVAFLAFSVDALYGHLFAA
jgi:hypothetical protein